ncbi:MAG TPA: HaeIII family restriction endonuclease [Bacteroidia bacterium]|jgi:hypothetical protein|nr:HaeIII family restriction endonuclease [Bacteroidia bacterium]
MKKPGSKDSGKAFEFALINEAFRILSINFSVNLVKDATYQSTQKSFLIFPQKTQQKYIDAAIAAINHIIHLEPKITSTKSNGDILTLQLMPDSAGQAGDVRDILFIRSNQNWEVGISAKNNHKAVKHSRLSDKNDFGDTWLGINCSRNYFSAIDHVFKNLRLLKSQNRTWPSVPNKASTVYMPVLNAFRDELNQINDSNPNIPEKLVSYLLGNLDFYKVIKKRTAVEIHGFNMHGTLSKAAQSGHKSLVHKLKLPKQIIDFDYKPGSKDTLLLYCDQGWQISFRIHSAATLVEPSLKFDINLVGQPNSLYSNHIPY